MHRNNTRKAGAKADLCPMAGCLLLSAGNRFSHPHQIILPGEMHDAKSHDNFNAGMFGRVDKD